ncbi:hypothetical protein [Treponema sp.]|uniref:hypothetical protein n=1 Tax=Treponema sp. TaxID=166 RepID=UPI003F0C2303
MKKTIKWFAVLAAMVMGLSFAGCSDSSDDDDDDDVVVPTVKEAKTSVEVKVLDADGLAIKDENDSVTGTIVLSDSDNTTYYFSDGTNLRSHTSEPSGKTDGSAYSGKILVADGKYYLQNAVYERGTTSDIETIEDTFTDKDNNKSLAFKAGNKVDYCADTSATDLAAKEYSYTNNAGVLTVVIDSDDPEQNITALYDGSKIYEVTELTKEADVTF